MALDPNFEWVNVEGQRAVRRLEDSSSIYPWKPDIRWAGDGPNEVTFTTALEGVEDSEMTVTVRAFDGYVAPCRISITMADSSALPRKVFTRLRITRVLDQIQRDLKMPVIQHQLGTFDEAEWEDPFLQVPRPGRKGRHDWEYALWAARYVTACEEHRRKPVALLESRWPGKTADTIRAILNKARNRGLLTKSPKTGLAGGVLTKRAKRLLEEHKGQLPKDEQLPADK
jgi:hypothetical protein|tara:strand:+ start:893 stop:1576 length:684 start_codon:yes stop_codon:yes gene_type:complete